LTWRDLISGSYVSWRLGNSIILISKTLENLNGSKDINRALENIKEDITTSAKEFQDLHKLK
jgi:hypothetical protein